MVTLPGSARSLTLTSTNTPITGRISGDFDGILFGIKGQPLPALSFMALRFDFIAKFDEALVTIILDGIDEIVGVASNGDRPQTRLRYA
jgi:hypothetical protein